MDVDSPILDIFTNPPSDSGIVPLKAELSPVTEEMKIENVESTPPTNLLDKNVLSAVIQICKKYNLKVSISCLLISN